MGQPCFAADEKPQTATLKASLSKPSATVGDTVTLTLSYVLPQGAKLPEKPETKGLENLSITGVKAAPGTISIQFIADGLTDMSLGPFSIAYADAKGNNIDVYSQKIALKMTSNLDKSPDKQQLKPIEDIIPTERIWPRMLMWGATAILAVLAVAVFAVWYFRWRKRGKTTVVLPPHVRARKDIEALNVSGIFEKGNFKAYYYRLSEILKKYLEEIRGFPAAEYTTEEIAFTATDLSDRELVVLLKRADLVKFADVVPATARKDEDIAAALAYITATEPRPETGAQGGKEEGGGA